MLSRTVSRLRPSHVDFVGSRAHRRFLSTHSRFETEWAEARNNHRIWRNPFLRQCEDGSVTRDQLKSMWLSYFPFCRDFTRYVAGFIAHLPSDEDRALATDNLHDETGRGDPAQRHSEIFRRFLRNSFAVARPDSETMTPHAARLASTFDDVCLRPRTPLHSAAFIALGCESIVPRYYGILLDAHRRLGFSDAELEFLRMHVSCDEQHAQVGVDIVRRLQGQLGMSEAEWAAVCRDQMLACLDAKDGFFTAVHEELHKEQRATVSAPLLDSAALHGSGKTSERVRAGGWPSMGAALPFTSPLSARPAAAAEAAFATSTPKTGSGSIGFAKADVNRDSMEPLPVPFGSVDTLIHRQVVGEEMAAQYSKERSHPVFGANLPTSTVSLSIGDIYPGEPAKMHRHAYESVLYVIEGSGYSIIEGQRVDWKKGDALAVPPWNWHEHHCTSEPRVRYVLATNLPLLTSIGQTVIRQEYTTYEAEQKRLQGAGK